MCGVRGQRARALGSGLAGKARRLEAGVCCECEGAVWVGVCKGLCHRNLCRMLSTFCHASRSPRLLLAPDCPHHTTPRPALCRGGRYQKGSCGHTTWSAMQNVICPRAF